MLGQTHQNASMNKMLTVEEVAHIMHVHPSTVRRWEKQGQLKSHRFGPKCNIRFNEQDVVKFVNGGGEMAK